MSNAAFGLIGVCIGVILGFAGNYILQGETRKWQIEDERRKAKQEPLKQHRQKIDDMMSLVAKSLGSDVPMDEIATHFGNLFLALNHLYQKGMLTESEFGEVGDELKQAREQEDRGAIIEIGTQACAWIEKAIDATY
jgi:hypothetical protein